MISKTERSENSSRAAHEPEATSSGSTGPLRAEREIAASQDEVWTFASDPSKTSSWVANTLDVLDASSNAAGKGMTTVERTRLLGPVVVTTHWEVVEFDPPHRQVHTADVPMARGTVVTLSLTPTPGGTRFRMTLDYQPMGLIGRVGDRLVGRKRQGIALERSLERLAQQLES